MVIQATQAPRSRVKVSRQPARFIHKNQRMLPPEMMPPWTGIVVDTIDKIPWECLCDWIPHDGSLEIKFLYALCPVKHVF